MSSTLAGRADIASRPRPHGCALTAKPGVTADPGPSPRGRVGRVLERQRL